MTGILKFLQVLKLLGCASCADNVKGAEHGSVSNYYLKLEYDRNVLKPYC